MSWRCEKGIEYEMMVQVGGGEKLENCTAIGIEGNSVDIHGVCRRKSRKRADGAPCEYKSSALGGVSRSVEYRSGSVCARGISACRMHLSLLADTPVEVDELRLRASFDSRYSLPHSLNLLHVFFISRSICIFHRRRSF